jgi:uncharacterized protein (DUF427 family)
MTLTVGDGPFGHHPAGRFNFSVPDDVEYLEESPRRVRGIVNGEAAIDSRRVKLLHASGTLPVWCFPPEDVKMELLREGDAWVHEEGLAHGLVGVRFDAIDRWLEEDEEAIVHPRDPYHRIDVRSSSRRVVVSLDGVTLADSIEALALFESSLPTRWYLPRDDVVAELVRREGFRTGCAYKGYAGYWDVRVGNRLEPALAWQYDDPLDDVGRIAGRVCFFNERVDLELDGELEPRPRTAWSGTDWLSGDLGPPTAGPR